MIVLDELSQLRQALRDQARDEDAVLLLIASMGEAVALESPSATSMPLLTMAAERRIHRAMRALIEQGVDLDATHDGHDHGTALGCACYARDPEGVKLLLAAGANPNAGPSRYKPIPCAIRSGSAECLELVLRAGGAPQWGAKRDTDIELATWHDSGSDRCLRLILDQPDAALRLLDLVRERSADSKRATSNRLTGAFAQIAPLLHDRAPEVWLPILREELATADPETATGGRPRAGLLAATQALAALEARALSDALRSSADPDREGGRAIEPEEIAHPAVASGPAVARRRPARV